MRISDCSSDLCSSDLPTLLSERPPDREREGMMWPRPHLQGSNMSMFPPLPFALSLFLSACKAVEGGRSFLSASQRKSTEERRVGNECVIKYSSRWPPYHKNNKSQQNHKLPIIQ